MRDVSMRNVRRTTAVGALSLITFVMSACGNDSSGASSPAAPVVTVTAAPSQPPITVTASPTPTPTAPPTVVAPIASAAPTVAPAIIVMPKLVGQNLQLAQDILQKQGSFVMDQTDALGLDRIQVNDSNWTVCAQDPKAGTEIEASAVVTLASVKLTEKCP